MARDKWLGGKPRWVTTTSWRVTPWVCLESWCVWTPSQRLMKPPMPAAAATGARSQQRGQLRHPETDAVPDGHRCCLPAQSLGSASTTCTTIKMPATLIACAFQRGLDSPVRAESRFRCAHCCDTAMSASASNSAILRALPAPWQPPFAPRFGAPVTGRQLDDAELSGAIDAVTGCPGFGNAQR